MAIDIDHDDIVSSDSLDQNSDDEQIKTEFHIEPEFNRIISDIAVQLDADHVFLSLPSTNDHLHVMSFGIPTSKIDLGQDNEKIRQLSKKLHEKTIQKDSIINKALDNYGDGSIESLCESLGVKRHISLPLSIDDLPRATLQFFYAHTIEPASLNESLLNLFKKQLSLILKQGNTIESLLLNNSSLRDDAETDGLTGLPNQQRIIDILEEEYERSRRYNFPLTVLMGDLDFFKQVNDNHGHLCGDEVLKKVGWLFRDGIRTSDEVGRYGGEEFLFVMPEIGQEEGYKAAERLRTELRSQELIDGVSDPITISFGVHGCESEDHTSVRGLVEKADKALYEAKNQGRDCTRRYESVDS